MIGALAIIALLAVVVTLRVVVMYRTVGRDRIRHWNDRP